MEFGIYLNQYQDPRSEFGYEDLQRQGREVEALGYDTVAVGERHFYDTGFLDPMPSLTTLATVTDRVDLMANILILPVYHPIRLAEQITNLDHLSDGRTRWGVSLGYRESELVNFGVPMEDRVGRFLEGIELLKRLLTGERFDYDGTHWSFEDGFISPTPVQEPRPRLWGGGSAEAAIKRAANRCDGFTAAITVPEELEADIDLYRESVAEFGGDPAHANVTMMIDGFVGATTDEAYDALDPYMLDLHEQYIKWGNPEFDDRPTFDDVDPQCLIGEAEEVAAKVEQYKEMGVDHLIFRTQFPGMPNEDAMRSVRRFATDVMPYV